MYFYKLREKYSQKLNWRKSGGSLVIFQGVPYLCDVQLEGPYILKTAALTNYCGVQLNINHLTIILTVKHFCQKHPLLTGTAHHTDAFFRIKNRRKAFLSLRYKTYLDWRQSPSAMPQKQEQNNKVSYSHLSKNYSYPNWFTSTYSVYT